MYFRVIDYGDPSVGISGDEATLSVDLDWYDDIEDKKEAIKLIGETLEKTFGELWSTSVKVYVDDESNKEEDLLTWRSYIKRMR